MIRLHRVGCAVTLAGLVIGFASPSLLAQWPRYTTPGPKTADGRPDVNAPAPRTPDGKPDLSGVWETIQGRRGPAPAVAAEGTGELPPSGSIFGNVGDQTPGGAPYHPWAAELVKKRMAENSKDNPDAHCLPMGVMQMTSHPYPKKIIQTPSEVVVIYEGSGTTVRELFLDGRVPAKDAEPWAYTKPFSATVNNRLVPDTQLIEFVCIEKSAVHYVGASGKR